MKKISRLIHPQKAAQEQEQLERPAQPSTAKTTTPETTTPSSATETKSKTPSRITDGIRPSANLTEELFENRGKSVQERGQIEPEEFEQDETEVVITAISIQAGGEAATVPDVAKHGDAYGVEKESGNTMDRMRRRIQDLIREREAYARELKSLREELERMEMEHERSLKGPNVDNRLMNEKMNRFSTQQDRLHRKIMEQDVGSAAESSMPSYDQGGASGREIGGGERGFEQQQQQSRQDLPEPWEYLRKRHSFDETRPVSSQGSMEGFGYQSGASRHPQGPYKYYEPEGIRGGGGGEGLGGMGGQRLYEGEGGMRPRFEEGKSKVSTTKILKSYFNLNLLKTTAERYPVSRDYGGYPEGSQRPSGRERERPYYSEAFNIRGSPVGPSSTGQKRPTFYEFGGSQGGPSGSYEWDRSEFGGREVTKKKGGLLRRVMSLGGATATPSK